MLLLLEHTGYGFACVLVIRRAERIQVEMMPWMRYIPSALAGWKRSAQQYYQKADKEFTLMFKAVQDRVVRLTMMRVNTSN